MYLGLLIVEQRCARGGENRVAAENAEVSTSFSVACPNHVLVFQAWGGEIAQWLEPILLFWRTQTSVLAPSQVALL